MLGLRLRRRFEPAARTTKSDDGDEDSEWRVGPEDASSPSPQVEADVQRSGASPQCEPEQLDLRAGKHTGRDLPAELSEQASRRPLELNAARSSGGGPTGSDLLHGRAGRAPGSDPFPRLGAGSLPRPTGGSLPGGGSQAVVSLPSRLQSDPFGAARGRSRGAPVSCGDRSLRGGLDRLPAFS